MKLFRNFALFSILATGAVSAERLDIDLSGSFYATSGHSIGLGGVKSAFVYSVYGASNLKTAKGKRLRFSVECLGFDELGSTEGTQGIGRCNWIDESKDKLFASLSTVGEGNKYKVIGGTGKWKNATGVITTTFIYLPTSSDKFFLGTEDGKGTIKAPNYK